MSSKRQQKFERLIQRELSVIFQQKKIEWDLPMITVVSVKVSPDIENAKVYLSLYDYKEKVNIVDFIKRLNKSTKTIKLEFSNRVGKFFRKCPSFVFYEDETYKIIEEINTALTSIKKK